MLEQELTIKAPRLVKFEERPTCPVCLAVHLVNYDDEAKLDDLLGIFSMSSVSMPLDRQYTQVAFHWCPGGKEPTETRTAAFGHVEVTHGCAGITTPHLHRFCNNCHYSWLSEVAGS